jgi:hypothetical protein
MDMDTSFSLTQARCYRQAARLMNKGVSLSVALRGCLPYRGSGTSGTKVALGAQAPTEGAAGSV